MANIGWIGTGGVAGKLTDNANWVGGTAPAGSDTALFSVGSQDVDPSLGQIAALDKIVILPGYTGVIGGSGNEMDSSCNSIIHRGTAEFWFKDAAGLTDDVHIQCSDPSTVVNLGGDTMTRVHLAAGNITLAGDVGTIAVLTITGGTVTGVSGATGYTTLIMSGGTLTTAVGPGTVVLSGGVLTQTGAVTNTTFFQTGGTYQNQSTGTITTYYGSGGLCDLGPEAKTITILHELPGFTLRADIGGVHTITTARYNRILDF